MLLLLLSLVLSLVLVDAHGKCLTPSQEQGNCINLKECTEINNAIATQQLTPNQIKHLHQSQCGKHNGQVLVCCPGTRQPIQQNIPRSNTPQQQNKRQQGLTFSSFLKSGETQPIKQTLKRPQQSKQPNRRPPAEFLTFSSFIKSEERQPIKQTLERAQESKQPNRRPPAEFLTFSSFIKSEERQPIKQTVERSQESKKPNRRPPVEFLTFSSFINSGPSETIQQKLQSPQPLKQKKRIPKAQGLTSSLFPKPGVCGKGELKKNDGSFETDIGEYPWVALLEYSKGGDSYGFLCGGSLINNRYVLTAAHCIKSTSISYDMSVISVRLGEFDTKSTIDCKTDINGNVNCADPPINIPIESSIMHENYIGTPTNKNHDIALIRLSKTVPYTQYISPVCLPLRTNLRSSNLDGSVFDVIGWGRTESKSSSNVKLKASVSTVDLESCISIFDQINVTLNKGQICAGGEEGVDSCSGDSGGPLIGIDNSNKKEEHFFLAGIVSFGVKKCASEGWPGVYTRVGHYIDWIEKKMKP